MPASPLLTPRAWASAEALRRDSVGSESAQGSTCQTDALGAPVRPRRPLRSARLMQPRAAKPNPLSPRVGALVFLPASPRIPFNSTLIPSPHTQANTPVCIFKWDVARRAERKVGSQDQGLAPQGQRGCSLCADTVLGMRVMGWGVRERFHQDQSRVSRWCRPFPLGRTGSG